MPCVGQQTAAVDRRNRPLIVGHRSEKAVHCPLRLVPPFMFLIIGLPCDANIYSICYRSSRYRPSLISPLTPRVFFSRQRENLPGFSIHAEYVKNKPQRMLIGTEQ